SCLRRIATREPWTHSKKLLEALQAFSLAAPSYISIEHVPGCWAPQAPAHALKSAARLSRIVLPELPRRLPTLDIVEICTIDPRASQTVMCGCYREIVVASWKFVTATSSPARRSTAIARPHQAASSDLH